MPATGRKKKVRSLHGVGNQILSRCVGSGGKKCAVLGIGRPHEHIKPASFVENPPDFFGELAKAQLAKHVPQGGLVGRQVESLNAFALLGDPA
jgi:hypothetical protein